LKILHLTTDTNYGGVQEVVLFLCRYVQAEHFLLRMHPGPLEASFSEVCSIMPHGFATFEQALPEILPTLKPDIVHAHNPGGSFPLFMQWLVAHGWRVVESHHCWTVSVAEEEQCAARVVASQALHNLQQSTKNLVVIPYPCDLEKALARKACRKQWREALGVPESGVVIGRLGNLTPWKCVPDFVRCVPSILQRAVGTGKPLAFVVAGSTHEAPEVLEQCLELVHTLGVSDNIHFISPASDKFGLLNSFDIFLYPTTRETMGISVLEAMACGLPVVSYEDSAVPEVVKDAGYLEAVGNIEGLICRVVELIADDSLRRSLGERARALVQQRNAPTTIAKAYEALYSKVLGGI